MKNINLMNQASKSNAYIVVLGIAQDAGYPQRTVKKNIALKLGKIALTEKCFLQ